jgi:hypothetical protein
VILTPYGLERFLYRLSVSPYRDSFVLEGALLLLLWTAETYRPTRDLDLLGLGVSTAGHVAVGLAVRFYDLPTKQMQWRAFLRKSGLRGDSSLKKIILISEMFVMPVVETILKNRIDAKVWSTGGPWKARVKL